MANYIIYSDTLLRSYRERFFAGVTADKNYSFLDFLGGVGVNDNRKGFSRKVRPNQPVVAAVAKFVAEKTGKTVLVSESFSLKDESLDG